MYSNGFDYRLTKHGRQRFIERVGKGYTDTQMLTMAIQMTRKEIPGYKVEWAPDWTYPTTGRRLVTVLLDESCMIDISNIN